MSEEGRELAEEEHWYPEDLAAAAQRLVIIVLLAAAVTWLALAYIRLGHIQENTTHGQQQCQSQSGTTFTEGGAETTTVTECRSTGR